MWDFKDSRPDFSAHAPPNLALWLSYILEACNRLSMSHGSHIEGVLTMVPVEIALWPLPKLQLIEDPFLWVYQKASQ